MENIPSKRKTEPTKRIKRYRWNESNINTRCRVSNNGYKDNKDLRRRIDDLSENVNKERVSIKKNTETVNKN